MAKRKTNGDVTLTVTLGIILVFLGVLLDDSLAAAVITFLVYVLAVYTMTRVPVITSMLTLMAGAFMVENPLEGFASGVWSSPFRNAGAILVNHLNTVDRTMTGVSWMSFSGLDLCFGALLIIVWSRHVSRSKIDGAVRIPTPRPLLRLALISLLGAGYALIVGVFLHGGNFSMALWQLDRVIYLPIVFFLFQAGIRGPEDIRAIGRVILLSGTFRAFLAIYISSSAEFPAAWGELPFATTHHDSMLFAACLVILVTLIMERVPKAIKLAAFIVPILFLGMIRNNRRLAWVQTACVLLTIYLISADNPVKRKIRRLLVASIPFNLLYIAIGWNRGTKWFKPVQIMRSVVDAESNGSSFWREIENFNLVRTMRDNPLLGTGYGVPYTEYVTMPAVDYSLEFYLPHNSILGLWAFTGVIGYSALTLLWAGGVYFAMRTYHATTDRVHRAAAQVCFGVVVIYMIQCWGDLGLGTWAGVFLMGASIAASGKLAVMNGEWNPKTVPDSPFSIA